MSDERPEDQTPETQPTEQPTDAPAPEGEAQPESDTPVEDTSATQSTPFADAWAEATNLWIHGHLRNSPLAEATQAWNHVMGKLPLLGALVETALASKKE